MKKVIRILSALVLLSIQTCLYGQENKSDSMAYEMANSKFRIDTSLTGFKLASIFENNFIYTPNGNVDLHSDIETSGFGIMPLSGMTFIKGVEFIQKMETTFEQDGSTIRNLQRNDTIINGNKLCESTFEVVNKTNKVDYVYQAFLKGERSSIAFFGKDIDNGKYIINFKKTFRNIRL